MNNNIIRNGTYIIGSLLLSIIIGTILMLAVYCIPISPIRVHVSESLYIYEVEGDYYKWAPDYKVTQQDNFTDALMLSEAAFLGTGSLVNDAMNNPYISYGDESSFSSILARAMSSDTIDDSAMIVDYPRYWHGYLVYLKPLLCVFNVSDIRILNMCIQFILILVLSVELYKVGGYGLALSAAAAIIVINPLSTVLCLQLSDILFITLIGGLVLIGNQHRRYSIWHVFLWIGITTAYIDFLTYPVVTLGFNLLLILYLYRLDALRAQGMRIISCSISWGIGYAGMWIGKWIISWILTGYNTIQDGINNVQYRTAGGADELISFMDVVSKIFRTTGIRPYIMAAAISVLMVMIRILLSKRLQIIWSRILTYMIVGIYPFLWYMIVRNHSKVHSFMAYRELAITVMAIGIILADINSHDTTALAHSE